MFTNTPFSPLPVFLPWSLTILSQSTALKHQATHSPELTIFLLEMCYFYPHEPKPHKPKKLCFLSSPRLSCVWWSTPQCAFLLWSWLKASQANRPSSHQLQWVWKEPVGHWLTKLVCDHLCAAPCLICWQNWPCNALFSTLAYGTGDQVSCSASALLFFSIIFELFPPFHDDLRRFLRWLLFMSWKLSSSFSGRDVFYAIKCGH